MLIQIIKTVIIAVLAIWIIGLVASLLALPAGLWVLFKALVIVWAVYEILKAF